MTKKLLDNLHHELHVAGASENEIAQLLPIAGKLRSLGTSEQLPRRPIALLRRYIFGAGALAGAVALAIVILVAMPLVSSESPFYGTQKLADRAIVSVYSNYRGTLMMKQAAYIETLVRTHAQTKTVLATLADYQTTAGAYATAGSPRYSTLEYCKTKLESAAAQAPNDQRQAITHSLERISGV